MITETLFGFACLIANGDPTDETVKKTQIVVRALSVAQQQEVQAVIESGSCVPAVFERLMKETRAKVEAGTIQELYAPAGPSETTV